MDHADLLYWGYMMAAGILSVWTAVLLMATLVALAPPLGMRLRTTLQNIFRTIFRTTFRKFVRSRTGNWTTTNSINGSSTTIKKRYGSYSTNRFNCG